MLCKVILLAGLSYFSPTKPDGDDPIDTINIEGIVVNSKLQRFSNSLSLKVIPASQLKISKQLVLTDVLSPLSNIAINNYGQGGVSVATLRGLGSYHTAILWNGINLQNSMNGGVNLTNIPVNFIDQLAIQYGGNGALFGSGAIGGTIQLSNTLELGKGYSLELTQTYGSYSSYFTGLNATYSGNKFASSTRVFYAESANDYKYHNLDRAGRPYERQINANWSMFGLMQNFAYQISKKDKLNSSTWFQNAFNRYGPMTTGYTNREKDYNTFFRNVVQWSSTHEWIDINTKACYLFDTEKYRNPGISDTSNHSLRSTIFETEGILKLSQEHKIEAGINVNNEQVTSTNYPSIKKRTRPAFALTYKYSKINGGFDFYAGLREEMIETESNPITWTMGSRVKLSRFIYIRGNISKNYRIPVMNDLYWSGFMSKGNPSLKPEQGYSEELGLDFIFTKSNLSLVSKISAFNNNVSKWIVWMQDEKKTWTPFNVKKVWARGIDASVNCEMTFSKIKYGIELMGTETISTIESSNTKNEVGKQLIYVPKIKVSGSFHIDYNKFSIRYYETFTGKRYTSQDNSTFLDSYSIANLTIEKIFELKSSTLSTFIRINNLWNKEYQVRVYYPMPLRNYQFGVSILFNKPSH